MTPKAAQNAQQEVASSIEKVIKTTCPRALLQQPVVSQPFTADRWVGSVLVAGITGRKSIQQARALELTSPDRRRVVSPGLQQRETTINNMFLPPTKSHV